MLTKLNKPSKYCQSGEISPNLVTLVVSYYRKQFIRLANDCPHQKSFSNERINFREQTLVPNEQALYVSN